MPATSPRTIAAILDATAAGERLSAEDAIRLLESRELAAIGRAAHAVTQRLHPEIGRAHV